MYTEQSYEVIKNRMLTQLETDLDKREGSFINDMYAPISTEFARFYTEMDSLHSIYYIEDCYGEDLDKRVFEFGVPRKLGQRATGVITFVGEEMILVPRNMQVSTDGGYLFTTISQGYIKDGSVDILVEANEIGEKYNIEPKASWLLPNDVVVSELFNSSNFEGGVDIESDADLKKRFFDAVRNVRTSGNANDYVYWAKEVSGVVNAEVTPLHAGNGTVKVLISGEDRLPVSTEVLNECSRYIQYTCPIGSNPTVLTTTVFEVTVTVDIIVDDDSIISEVESKVTEVITQYITACVDKIYYNKLGARILSCEGVIDYTSLTINGSSSLIVNIPQDSVAVVESVNVSTVVGVYHE